MEHLASMTFERLREIEDMVKNHALEAEHAQELCHELLITVRKLINHMKFLESVLELE